MPAFLLHFQAAWISSVVSWFCGYPRTGGGVGVAPKFPTLNATCNQEVVLVVWN